MPSGIGVQRVTDEHAKLLDVFASSIIADDPGYSYDGKATYVTMVYDTRYIYVAHIDQLLSIFKFIYICIHQHICIMDVLFCTTQGFPQPLQSEYLCSVDL